MAIEDTEATARAVASHTGALASDSAAIDAACHAAGIVRVSAPQELVDVADGLLRAGFMRGRRIAVLTDGGGHAGIAAALLQRAGLRLPRVSDGLRARLRVGLPATAAVSNPIDLAGGGEQDIESFHRTTRALLESGEVDAVLISGYFGGYSEYSDAMGRAEVAVIESLAAAARTTGRPVVVHTMHPENPASALLRRSGVPVFRAIERAVDACARLAERGERGPTGVPRLPRAVAPVASGPAGASADPYTAARDLLAAGGVPFVPARTVTTGAEAASAAGELGYPLVLKALGTLHKSDVGGVALGLRDEAALLAALADMQLRLEPPAFTLERMAPLGDGVELLIGARWDARFGPIALIGLGGLFTEILRDAAVALAPVDEERARSMLLSLRAAPLLQGARGRPLLDFGAAAAALAALSRVAAEHPELAAIEVNPLLVLPDGALGLDARLEPAAS